MEDFVAFTAYVCERDELDVDLVLSAYLAEPDRARANAESEGLLRDGVVTGNGLVAATGFADDHDWITRRIPTPVREFVRVVELVEERAEQGRGGVADAALPDGFVEYESDRRGFEADQAGYVNNRAKEYESGARIEFDYRSRDPSGPFEMKPDRIRTVVSLSDLGRDITLRRGWTDER